MWHLKNGGKPRRVMTCCRVHPRPEMYRAMACSFRTWFRWPWRTLLNPSWRKTFSNGQQKRCNRSSMGSTRLRRVELSPQCSPAERQSFHDWCFAKFRKLQRESPGDGARTVERLSELFARVGGEAERTKSSPRKSSRREAEPQMGAEAHWRNSHRCMTR